MVYFTDMHEGLTSAAFEAHLVSGLGCTPSPRFVRVLAAIQLDVCNCGDAASLRGKRTSISEFRKREREREEEEREREREREGRV